MAEPTTDILSWLRKRLEEASPDLLREVVESFAEALMGAEADALCGALYRERSAERVNMLVSLSRRAPFAVSSAEPRSSRAAARGLELAFDSAPAGREHDRL